MYRRPHPQCRQLQKQQMATLSLRSNLNTARLWKQVWQRAVTYWWPGSQVWGALYLVLAQNAFLWPPPRLCQSFRWLASCVWLIKSAKLTQNYAHNSEQWLTTSFCGNQLSLANNQNILRLTLVNTDHQTFKLNLYQNIQLIIHCTGLLPKDEKGPLSDLGFVWCGF